MNLDEPGGHCIAIGQLTAFAKGTLPEYRAESLALHVRGCTHCDLALKLVERLIADTPTWPRDVLQPRADLWDRLAIRIAPTGTSSLRATTLSVRSTPARGNSSRLSVITEAST